MTKLPLYILIFFTIFLCSCTQHQAKPLTEPTITAGQSTSFDNQELLAFQLSIGLLEINEEDKAYIMLRKLAINSKIPAVFANLALLDFKSSNLDSAINHIEKAIKLEPDNHQYFNLLGLILIEKEDFKKAKNALATSIGLSPHYDLAYYNMALLHDIYLQDISNAITYYNKYLLVSNNDDTITQQWVKQLISSRNRD